MEQLAGPQHEAKSAASLRLPTTVGKWGSRACVDLAKAMEAVRDLGADEDGPSGVGDVERSEGCRGNWRGPTRPRPCGDGRDTQRGPKTGNQVVPCSWQELPQSGPIKVADDTLAFVLVHSPRDPKTKMPTSKARSLRRPPGLRNSYPNAAISRWRWKIPMRLQPLRGRDPTWLDPLPLDSLPAPDG